MIKRVAILANGGDVSGFNAVIRAIIKTAENNNIECLGFIDGYRGLLQNNYVVLGTSSTGNAVGILPKGGSIIGSSTNANVFNYPVDENGERVYKDLSDICVENIKKDGIDCLFTLGGDGTQKSARDLSLKGINVIGVPKTIDNDVACTEITFGYNTAVSVAADAIDRLHTTGETHHRIMVLEVMGRYAGWIALESAIAGGADVALIPEIPYDLNKIIDKVKERESCGKNFTIIVVAEGAKPKDGNVVISKIVKDSPDPIRLGGIGNKLAGDIECLMKDKEVRCTVLGHIQRGGNTCTYDRILSTRYGVAAVEMIVNREFGKMVCLKGDTITSDTLENVIGQKTKNVNPDGELVNMAKKIGISFAD